MRVAFVAAALAAVVLLALRLHRTDQCQSAQRVFFAAATGAAPLSATLPASRSLDSCPGTSALVTASGALEHLGLHARAAQLARQATVREPHSFSSWAAVYLSERTIDASTAAAALRRAQQLNPLFQPPPGPAPAPHAAVGAGGP